ncbi:MAG: hypothetical protein EA343_04810 [Nodularia sp. (in: Bacteria)]|nr:MAG: hypothetical protein EA343_04810 [Nodularia sp. (in: cyanobacteria)]
MFWLCFGLWPDSTLLVAQIITWEYELNNIQILVFDLTPPLICVKVSWFRRGVGDEIGVFLQKDSLLPAIHRRFEPLCVGNVQSSNFSAGIFVN